MKPHHKSIAVALICGIITPTLFGGSGVRERFPNLGYRLSGMRSSMAVILAG